MFNTQIWFLFFLFIAIIYFLNSRYEFFVDYSSTADIVQTSGVDTLTPLPYYTKYSYPFYWNNYTPPNIFYDIAYYGPIARPWPR